MYITIILLSLVQIHFSLYGVAEQKLDCGLRVVHVNGDLYYFTPSISMSDLQPGGQLVCNWHQKWWNTAKTDFFPNWYYLVKFRWLQSVCALLIPDIFCC